MTVNFRQFFIEGHTSNFTVRYMTEEELEDIKKAPRGIDYDPVTFKQLDFSKGYCVSEFGMPGRKKNNTLYVIPFSESYHASHPSPSYYQYFGCIFILDKYYSGDAPIYRYLGKLSPKDVNYPVVDDIKKFEKTAEFKRGLGKNADLYSPEAFI